MAYEGNPFYVRRSFKTGIGDCFRHALPGDEWGELIGRMVDLAEQMDGIDGEERQEIVNGWIFEELEAAHKQDWWYNDLEAEVLEARTAVGQHIEACRKRWTFYPLEVKALEDEIAKLPAWMLPPSQEETTEQKRREVREEIERHEAELTKLTQKLRDLG